MNLKQLKTHTHHRPWKLPEEGWRFYQEWNDALFLHWQVNYGELRKLVPPELEIDLFEGRAWVSFVAFTMEKIRPRYLPSFSPVSYFHEINIRTYIKSGHKTGVYFLSMEGSKRLSCLVAKAISELPYRYSKMTREAGYFSSYNLEFNNHFSAKYTVGKTIAEKEALLNWLTERYALFQDAGDSINEFEVHHLPWSVQEVEIEKLTLSYPGFQKLLAGPPQIQHYSSGVQVLAWGKEKTKKGRYRQKTESGAA